LIKSPGSIFIQKNFNGGGVVAEESGADARTAQITLYHDAAHPSYLEIPVVEEVNEEESGVGDLVTTPGA
jgi:hypothetical protein